MMNLHIFRIAPLVAVAVAIPVMDNDRSLAQCTNGGTAICGGGAYITDIDDVVVHCGHATPWSAEDTITGAGACPGSNNSLHCQVSVKVMSEGGSGETRDGHFGFRFYDEDKQGPLHHVAGCKSVTTEEPLVVEFLISGSAVPSPDRDNRIAGTHDYIVSYNFNNGPKTYPDVVNNRFKVIAEIGDHQNTTTCTEWETYSPPGFTIHILVFEDTDVGGRPDWEDAVFTVDGAWYGHEDEASSTGSIDIGWNHKARFIIEEE